MHFYFYRMRLLALGVLLFLFNHLRGQSFTDTIPFEVKDPVFRDSLYGFHVNWGISRNSPTLDTFDIAKLRAIVDNVGVDSLFIFVQGRNYDIESLNSAEKKGDLIRQIINDLPEKIKFRLICTNQYIKYEDYGKLKADDPMNYIYFTIISILK